MFLLRYWRRDCLIPKIHHYFQIHLFSRLRGKMVFAIYCFSANGANNYRKFLTVGKKHLWSALIYRMKPQNHTIIYIGNVGLFNEAPSVYIMEEIFYWFYEEIRDSTKVQTILGQIVRRVDDDQIISVWKTIFREINQICDSKGKKIVFIFDQFNEIEFISLNFHCKCKCTNFHNNQLRSKCGNYLI